MPEELYTQKLKDAYDALKQRTRGELIGIRREINLWKWPAALGEAPVEEWGALPDYRRPWMPENTVTKYDYLKPYADAILALGVSHWDTLEQ